MTLRRKRLIKSSLSFPYLTKTGHFGHWRYPGAKVRKPYPLGETYNTPKFRVKAVRRESQPKEAETPYKEPPPKINFPEQPLRSPNIAEVVQETEKQRETQKRPEIKPTSARVRKESRAPTVYLRKKRPPAREEEVVEAIPVEEEQQVRRPKEETVRRGPESRERRRPIPAEEEEIPIQEEAPPRREREPTRERERPRVMEEERIEPIPEEEFSEEEVPEEEITEEPLREDIQAVQDLVDYIEERSADPEAPPEYRTIADEIRTSIEEGDYTRAAQIAEELPSDERLAEVLSRLPTPPEEERREEALVSPEEREVAAPPEERPGRVGRPAIPEIRPSRLREGEEVPITAEDAGDAIRIAQEEGITPENQRAVQGILQDMPPQELRRLGEQLGSTGETPEQLINDIMASAGTPPEEEERRTAREEYIDSYLNEIKSQIGSIGGGEQNVLDAKAAKLARKLVNEAMETGDIDRALDTVDQYLNGVDPQGNDIRYNPLRNIVERLGRLRQSEVEAETREAGGGISPERALGTATTPRERIAPTIPRVGGGRLAEGRAERRAAALPPSEGRGEVPSTGEAPRPPAALPTELGRARVPPARARETREKYKERPKEVRLSPSPVKEAPPESPLTKGSLSGLGDPLPSEEDLKSATIVPLIPGSDVGQVSGPVSKVTVGDRSYFIKESTEANSLNEILAPRLGELVGVIIPKTAKINSPYPVGVISNWVIGRPLDSVHDYRAEIGRLPKDMIARHLLFSYLVGDFDGHSGQYIIVQDGTLVRIDAESFFEYDEGVGGIFPDSMSAAISTIVDNDLFTSIGGFNPDPYAIKGMGRDFPISHQVINNFLTAGPELVKILEDAGKDKAAQGVSQRLEWLSQIQDTPNPTIGDFLYDVLGWQDAKRPTPTLEEKIEAPAHLIRMGENPIVGGASPSSPPIDFPASSEIIGPNDFTPVLKKEVVEFVKSFSNRVGIHSGLYVDPGLIETDLRFPNMSIFSYLIARDSDGAINGLMLLEDKIPSVPGQEAVYVNRIMSHRPVSERLFRAVAREAAERNVPLVVAKKKLTPSDFEPADLAEKAGIYTFDLEGNAVLLPHYARVFADTGVVPSILDKIKDFTKAEDLRKRIVGKQPGMLRRLKRDRRDIESQMRSLQRLMASGEDPSSENAELYIELQKSFKEISNQIKHEESPYTQGGREILASMIEDAVPWNRTTRGLEPITLYTAEGKKYPVDTSEIFETAVDFVDTLISSQVYSGPRSIKAIPSSTGRSCYDTETQTVEMSPTSPVEIAVHEIFHHFANVIDSWERIFYEFMMNFTGGQVPQRMKDLYPDKGYRDNEYVRKMDVGYFNDISSWYLGKMYPDGTTEVPAMFGQALFDDPVGFCSQCPLGATLILSLLTGEFRSEIPWDQEGEPT